MCTLLCGPIDPVEYFGTHRNSKGRLVTRWIVTTDQAKFKKTGKGSEYIQVGVILSPARESSRWAVENGLKRHKPLCSHFSAGCEKVCLRYSGQLVFGTSAAARILRTMLFIHHREIFLAYVLRDLKKLERKAHKLGKILVVRFDTLSDTDPEIYRAIMDAMPVSGFVDYTKDPGKYQRYLAGQLHAHHHLTFSRSETNEKQAAFFVSQGGTATVVVRDEETMERYLRDGYKGRPCVDGTISDRRWDDPKGHWVLLTALGKARNDTSGFVVD